MVMKTFMIQELTQEKVQNVEETTEINSYTEDSKESGREYLDYDEDLTDALNNWHHRIGHLSASGIRHLSRLGFLELTKDEFRNN